MANERSTKQQVQAYRFGLRRVEQALATGRSQAAFEGGPRPGLSLIIGAVIAGLVTAGFAVYGFVKPAPAIGNATVLVDTDSGGAFVVRDGVAHPALNYASALLAASTESEDAGEGAPGGPPQVARVTTATLGTLPKGQLVGIPGAPNQVPTEDELGSGTWQACDLLVTDPAAAAGTAPTMTTTVVIGGPTPPASPATTAFLVTTGDGTSQLVHDGRRFRIDVRDAALAEGLGIDPARERPIALGTLNAIPEGEPLVRPEIPGQGKPVTLGGESFTIGEIVRVERATGGVGFYVALEDGVQQVGPVFADVVRAVTGQGERVRTVPPAMVAAAPVTGRPLPMDAFPSSRPELLGVSDAPGLCVGWRLSGGRPTWRVEPVTELPIPAGGHAVPAPPSAAGTARGTGGVADEVWVAPGSGLAIGQASAAGTASEGNLFLVTDQGIAYPVVSQAAMSALGLRTLSPAPPEFVSLLPLGPTLDPVAARRFFDDAPAAAVQ